jgi:LPXTG-motif cell wall-anchored protein
VSRRHHEHHHNHHRTATFDEGAFASDTQTLPNTGGAPLLMALAGGLTAAGAFCLRRKIS